MRDAWLLDPAIAFLNHGSFGACPIAVLEAQQRLRAEIERQPVQFFVRELGSRLDAARTKLAAFLGANADDLAFVPNATTAVNAVLRSLPFEAGDEILTTNHGYNACQNAAAFVAERSGCRVAVAEVPFPIASADVVLERVLARVTPRTRLALLDHVTSPTGLVFPLPALVRALAERGVDTLVDGAHAAGMLALDLDAIGAAYYAGNCHKWLCAPKGAGFLHVRRDRQALVRPLSISHGANSPRRDRSRFRLEFDWMGTDDPSAYLCVPEAIRYLETLCPGGWTELRARNRALALEARTILREALDQPIPCPDDMIGALAALPLPDGSPEPPMTPLYGDPLQDVLLERFAIEVPIVPWPAPPRRLVRISAQLYNTPAEYARLADALRSLFRSGER